MYLFGIAALAPLFRFRTAIDHISSRVLEHGIGICPVESEKLEAISPSLRNFCSRARFSHPAHAIRAAARRTLRGSDLEAYAIQHHFPRGN